LPSTRKHVGQRKSQPPGPSTGGLSGPIGLRAGRPGRPITSVSFFVGKATTSIWRSYPGYAIVSSMPRRASKPRKGEDINEAAYRVVREATEDQDPERRKNPAAVALGKLGAAKGGRARARKLSAAKRKAIAQKAARARWKKAE
jgi:hypothetical protein